MLPSLNEIKKRRVSLGLTQGRLAKLAGISQSLVAKIESGKADPSYSNAGKIFEALDSLHAKEEKKAEQIMASPVLCAKPSEQVGRALSLMREKGISQLPVVDGGVVVGTISENAILSLLEKGYRMEDVRKTAVSSVIEPSLPQVGRGTRYSAVISLLKENPAILVVEKGKILGIITKADLVR
ncbi:MAG: CBS domain-containing protein [Candidatus Micrarchaeota archaeon]